MRRALPLSLILLAALGGPVRGASRFYGYYRSASQQRDPAKAAKLWHAAIANWRSGESKQDLSKAYATLGGVYVQLGRHGMAHKYTSKAIKLWKRNGTAYLNKAAAYHAQHRFGKAIGTLSKARRLIKSGYEFQLSLNSCSLYAAWGDGPRAMPFCDKVVSLASSNPWTFLNRASARVEAGDYDGALSDAGRAAELLAARGRASGEGMSAVHLNRGAALHGKGDHSGALAELRRSVKTGRESRAQARWRMGLAHAAMGARDAALREMNRAIELDPLSERAYVERGSLHLRMGRPSAAGKDFDKALSITPLPEAHYRRGLHRISRGDYEGAASDLTAAVKGRSSFPKAFAARAKAREYLGRIEAARKDYRKACRQGLKRACSKARGL